jgi:hypothetical protein
VIRPDGKLSCEYSKTLLAEKGAVNIKIPFAMNDILGKWRIEVSEVASSVSSVSEIKLEK